MPTIVCYLIYSVVLGILDATALSLRLTSPNVTKNDVSSTGLSRVTASPFGYNVSSKNIVTPSGAFPGHEVSTISSNMSPTSPDAHKSTFNNYTLVTNATSSSACCFVVQDTIEARYWADYTTYSTVISNKITTFITFATQYIDVIVTTNVSKVVSRHTYTSTVTTALGGPNIPNIDNEAPGPSVAQVGLNGSVATSLGATITSPTQFYVFPSVNVINVPAVTDKDGRPACATTSVYRATCPAQIYAEWNLTALQIHDAKKQSALYVTGINSNAERYFDSMKSPINLEVVQFSFTKPFVHAPRPDQFPSNVVNEKFGYVPQALIEWMAQNSEYVSKFPEIASCLPGGPSFDFSAYFCPTLPDPEAGFQLQISEPELTVSSTVTVAGKGCFHPGACPTPATPGAAAAAATPDVTPETEPLHKAGESTTAHAQDTSSPTGSESLPSPQAPGTPLLEQAENPTNTPVVSPENQAENSPPSPLPNSPNPPQPEPANQSPSATVDSSGSPLVKFPGNPHEATSPSNSPAEPPSDLQALGAIIGSGVGITPASPPESQDAQPIPGPGPTKNYSISIAPFASAVVINGVTSFLSASWPKGPVAAGTMAIAVGSQQISQNAASQYVVAGQTITPGAPPITVSGTPISLNSAATQVVIGSNTLDLTPATAPPLLSFDSQIFTANSASDYIIDGQTLVPGAPALTISNTPISLAPDGSKVVIGGSTETLRPGPTLPPLIIGSQTFTANEAGAYIIGSQTLTPGASGIVVPGSLLAPGASASVFTVAGQVFTANPTAFSIDGTTISAGGPGVTISGIPVALQASGLLDVGKSTITLASAKHSDGLGALPTFTGEGDQLSLRLLYSVLASVLSLLIATMV